MDERMDGWMDGWMVLNENLLPQHVEFNNTANGLNSGVLS